MVRLIAIATTLALLTQQPASAVDATPIGHSTVRIVFVVPIENARAVRGRLNDDATPVQMATAGKMIMSYDSIRPVSISIDGDFVGHALFGYDKVSPVYVLPAGKRKFTFVCDGFKAVTQELSVLGTGSTQYLIVKMTPVAAANASTPAEAVSRSQTNR